VTENERDLTEEELEKAAGGRRTRIVRQGMERPSGNPEGVTLLEEDPLPGPGYY